MKLILPEGVTTVSHEGVELAVENGMLEVDGDAFVVFHEIHGFKTEAEVAALDEEAGRAAAVAAAVVTSNKRK